MDNKTLKQERRLRHLTQLIKEAVITTLAEQSDDLAQQQAQAVPPPPPVQPQQEVPVATEPQVDVNTMTVDSMIERLNVIRGGKSFTDPEVYEQMTGWYDKVPPEEKMILDKSLQEIGKAIITASEVAQQPAKAPQTPAPTAPAPVAPQAPQAAPQAPIAPV